MARAAATIRRDPDRAVPRHARGRARRGGEHARRLPARPRRLLRRPRQARRRHRRRRDSDDAARLSARARASAASPPPSVARRLSAIRQLYRFLYAEGQRGDDPAAVIEGPKRGRALPKVLHQAGRRPAGAGARRRSERRRHWPSGCARRGSMPAGTALRHRLARLGTGVAAGLGAARAAHAGGARQGRHGAAGAAQRRAKRAMTEYLALRAEAQKRAPKSDQIEMAVPLVRRERPPHPPAFRARTEVARRRRRPARRRR